MIIGACGIGWDGKSVRKTLNLKGLDIGGISCEINGFNEQTLMGWVRADSTGWNYAVGPSWLESGGWGGTYFGVNSDTMEVRFGTGDSQSKKQFPYTLQLSEWHHYCFTRNSEGEYDFYCDGVFVERQSGTSSNSANNGNIFYLTHGISGNTTITVDIGIVGYSAFSRALSVSEVRQAFRDKIIDTSKPPYNSGLLLGMNILEGSGNRLYDVVSGEYAEISGEPSWNFPFDV